MGSTRLPAPGAKPGNARQGDHLNARTKTGYSCAYQPHPDRPVAWKTQRVVAPGRGGATRISDICATGLDGLRQVWGARPPSGAPIGALADRHKRMNQPVSPSLENLSHATSKK